MALRGRGGPKKPAIATDENGKPFTWGPLRADGTRQQDGPWVQSLDQSRKHEKPPTDDKPAS